MNIIILNSQKTIPIPTRRIQIITKKILKTQKIKKALLSVVFVSANKMRALNKQFLKHDYVTDVLTFKGPKNFKCFSGEIIIAPQVAKQNARLFKTSVEHELVLYIVHGILHLLGYDDHKPADIKKMRAAEGKIMELIA